MDDELTRSIGTIIGDALAGAIRHITDIVVGAFAVAFLGIFFLGFV